MYSINYHKLHSAKIEVFGICKHKAVDNKLANKKIKIGRCKPCFSRNNNLCCKQMADTNYFINKKTGKRFYLLHNLNCKSKYLIYLIKCTLCNFKPYIGKFETPSNLCTNNHSIDSTKENAIPVDKHFSEPGHDFTKHAQITLIEKIENHTNDKARTYFNT